MDTSKNQDVNYEPWHIQKTIRHSAAARIFRMHKTCNDICRAMSNICSFAHACPEPPNWAHNAHNFLHHQTLGLQVLRICTLITINQNKKGDACVFLCLCALVCVCFWCGHPGHHVLRRTYVWHPCATLCATASHIGEHECLCACMCGRMHVVLCVCVCLYVCESVSTFVRVCVEVCLCVWEGMWVSVFMPCVYVFTCFCVDACKCDDKFDVWFQQRRLCCHLFIVFDDTPKHDTSIIDISTSAFLYVYDASDVQYAKAMNVIRALITACAHTHTHTHTHTQLVTLQYWNDSKFIPALHFHCLVVIQARPLEWFGRSWPSTRSLRVSKTR